MKKFSTLFFILTISVTLGLSQGDVVIQEILYNPAPGDAKKIAFKNISSSTLDVSNWCLCNRPAYEEIVSTSFTVKGTVNPMAFAPGEVLVLEVNAGSFYNQLDNASELALYHRAAGCGGYNTAANLEDYVAWGVDPTTHGTRGAVAVSAGLWPNENDFTSAASQGESMQYDGTNTGGGNLTTSADFFNALPSALLPVELIDFRLEANSKSIKLLWSTASETNNDYFEIERSRNGLEYEPIDRIQGAGNSIEIQHYEYFDYEIVLDELVFYRLKQVDYDGEYSYSSVRIVQSEIPLSDIEVYPNPIESDGCFMLRFNLKEEREVLINLYDTRGNRIYAAIENLPEGNNEIPSEILNLSTGIYFLRVGDESRTYFKYPILVK